MEILLIAACAWLVHTAGAQSEQSRLGISPAQRAIMREGTRHEKAVQRIADKHGVASPASPAPGAPAQPAAPAPVAPQGAPVLTVPEAFRSGYRGHTPVQRVATPMGRRAGGAAARGVAWAEDTGKGALREYRRRRRAKGHADPAPVLVPVPPTHAPAVPAMPTAPPTAGVDSGGDKTKGVSLKKPGAAGGAGGPAAPPATTGPGGATVPVVPTPPAVPDPAAAPVPATPQPVIDKEPAVAGEGVGRMAAEVTYESAMDESDELSIMCDDDVRVYDRIRTRAEREIGRGDTLIAELEDAGFGPSVIGWVARCKENYQVIHSQIDGLQQNTIAQGEAVVKAKALLEAGQGVYADIAKDMESVAERGAYISDAVDAEDTSAHTEVYETKAA